MVLSKMGKRRRDTTTCGRPSIWLPTFPDGHDHLGLALAKMERMDEAIEQFQKAIELDPASAEYRFNLGFAMESRGDFAGAIAPLEKSVELSGGKDWNCLAALATAYSKSGRSADAIQSARQALDLAVQEHDDQLARNLREMLEGYERDGGKSPSQ